MRGYTYRELPDDQDFPGLARFEALAVNAVGHVIEFWGFKRNHGRIWCLLYLRADPMSSSDLQEALELSKGAVSMITRDLIHWGVTHRTRVKGSNAWHFVAEVDFLKMLRRVIKERELQMVEHVRDDLKDALFYAREDDDVDEATVGRLRAMVRLADMVADAVSFFLKTMQLDFTEADDVLDE
jgi:HTH-type transcriptional regulator, glycine betaine synthesis regulator